MMQIGFNFDSYDFKIDKLNSSNKTTKDEIKRDYIMTNSFPYRYD